MDEKEWLESLKEGDKVAVRYAYGNKYRIGVIEKITKTQICIFLESRYRRKDGQECGETGWDRQSIEPITPEIVEWILRDNFSDLEVGELSKTLSTSQIERITAIIKEK